jgi:hypothetical protein
MHVPILAPPLLSFAWPIGLAVFAALLVLIAAKKSKKLWRLAHRHSVQRTEHRHPTAMNAAFEEYRAGVLRRLDAERAQFGEFLERLRASKDKEEFDRFLSDRRSTAG